MRRSRFATGQAHQEAAVVWARRRLADRRSGRFRVGRRVAAQDGVILADGVGLGKTWEALAAAAILLVEGGTSRRDGRGRGIGAESPVPRRKVRRRSARVLVLCPPGLVSKWAREVRDPAGFSARLRRWAEGHEQRSFVLETLTEPFEIRYRADLAGLPSGSLRDARFLLPPGTYVCNWNVLRGEVGAGRSRLAALRTQDWDVLIVDEAHHREARAAMRELEGRARRIRSRLLLTATPFQLEPRELHPLLAAAVDPRDGAHRVLALPPMSQLVAALAATFAGGEPPPAALKRAAERTLRQVVARSPPRGGTRRYHLLDAAGRAHAVAAPETLRPADLIALAGHMIAPPPEFECSYLRRRAELGGGPRTFVSTKLREALSTVGQARASGARGDRAPAASPRLQALTAWMRDRIGQDLQRTAEDGRPRKSIVFTSFVRRAAPEIRAALAVAAAEAWRAVRDLAEWRCLARRAGPAMAHVLARLEERVAADPVLARAGDAHQLLAAVRSLAGAPPDPVRALFGHPVFATLAYADLQARLSTLAAVLRDGKEVRAVARLRLEERRGLRAGTRALGRCRAFVATYTGNDDRRLRDAAGDAFRGPFWPWVLVASNVGSEGIDLHTWAAHLVHFDIEWNPARMEQREGRGDRLGRRLAEPLGIYYLLVRGTYDERMLHQMVARQRWHAVLLGKPAARLARDEQDRLDAPLLEAAMARRLALDLRPTRRRTPR